MVGRGGTWRAANGRPKTKYTISTKGIDQTKLVHNVKFCNRLFGLMGVTDVMGFERRPPRAWGSGHIARQKRIYRSFYDGATIPTYQSESSLGDRTDYSIFMSWLQIQDIKIESRVRDSGTAAVRTLVVENQTKPNQQYATLGQLGLRTRKQGRVTGVSNSVWFLVLPVTPRAFRRERNKQHMMIKPFHCLVTFFSRMFRTLLCETRSAKKIVWLFPGCYDDAGRRPRNSHGEIHGSLIVVSGTSTWPARQGDRTDATFKPVPLPPERSCMPDIANNRAVVRPFAPSTVCPQTQSSGRSPHRWHRPRSPGVAGWPPP